MELILATFIVCNTFAQASLLHDFSQTGVTHEQAMSLVNQNEKDSTACTLETVTFLPVKTTPRGEAKILELVVMPYGVTQFAVVLPKKAKSTDA